MHSPKPDPEGDAFGERLRGLPQDGRSLGTAAHVPQLRTPRLLRFLEGQARDQAFRGDRPPDQDRKSTRLNSSHLVISYAVFCLKKKKKTGISTLRLRSCFYFFFF